MDRYDQTLIRYGLRCVPTIVVTTGIPVVASLLIPRKFCAPAGEFEYHTNEQRYVVGPGIIAHRFARVMPMTPTCKNGMIASFLNDLSSHCIQLGPGHRNCRYDPLQRAGAEAIAYGAQPRRRPAGLQERRKLTPLAVSGRVRMGERELRGH